MGNELVLGGDLPPVVVKKGSPRRVAPWVKDHSVKEGWDAEGAYVALTVAHLQGEKEVQRWAASEIQKPDDFARRVMEACQEYTGGEECRCDFELRAYANGEPFGKVYRLAMTPGDGGEAPTMQGVLRMTMRQNEDAHRLLITERQATVQAYERTIQFQDKQIRRLESDNESLRKKLDRAHKREAQWLQAERESMREERAQIAGIKWDPERLERVGGKFAGGVERVATFTIAQALDKVDDAGMVELLKTWGPEKLAKLAQILGDLRGVAASA